MNTQAFSQWFKVHEPKICLAAGITTMVGAGVLTGVQTVKAVRAVDRRKEEQNVDKLPPVDIFKTVWKYYIPPALMFLGSSGLFIRGYYCSAAALESSALSYNYLKNSFDMYKQNVKEVIGEKKESEVRARVAEKRVEANPPPKELEAGDSPVGNNLIWCLDGFSGRYFRSNIDKLRATEAILNNELLLDDWVPLNDLYYHLGLDPVKAGELNGWSLKNGAGSIKFTYDSILVDGQPILVLNYDIQSEYFA